VILRLNNKDEVFQLTLNSFENFTSNDHLANFGKKINLNIESLLEYQELLK
jgi:hypothetical protein